MKLVIGEYEVDIRVKAKGESKTSKFDTMHFLNELACDLNDAEEFNSREGFPALARREKEMSKDIYTALKGEGFYY